MLVNRERPFHIAHIINALQVGGAEKLIVTLAHVMAQRNIPLTVITLRHDIPAVKAEVEAAGAKVINFYGYKQANPVRFWRLLRFVKQEQFNVLHTHLTLANNLGGMVGRLLSVPVVTTLHNIAMQSQTHPVNGRIESWLLQHNAAQVIAVGENIAEAHHNRLAPKPITVIPNAVASPPPLAPEERIRLRGLLMDNPAGFLLIAVNRLEPQKGLPDLLQAFAQLLTIHPQARLIIAGKGSQEAALRTQITQMGLDGKATLLGVRHDVPALLAASDIFVSASHWEGLPVAVLEAMAAGLPVVATAVGELPRVITTDSGLLVPAKKPDQLALAIDLLVSNPLQRANLGRAAQARAAQLYGAEAWLDRLLEVYAAVAKQRTS